MQNLCFGCIKSKKEKENRRMSEPNHARSYDNYAMEPDVEVIYNPSSGALELTPSQDKHKYDISNAEISSSAVIVNPNFFDEEVQKQHENSSKSAETRIQDSGSPHNSKKSRSNKDNANTDSYKGKPPDGSVSASSITDPNTQSVTDGRSDHNGPSTTGQYSYNNTGASYEMDNMKY